MASRDVKDEGNGPADPTQSRFIYLEKLPGDKGFATHYATSTFDRV